MCKHFGEDKVSQKKFILNILFDFRSLELAISRKSYKIIVIASLKLILLSFAS